MNYRNISDNELLELLPSNEFAYEMLLKKYYPLIFSCAKKHYEQNKSCGIEINDLINEGFLGLVRAIDTFSDNKETKFYTYAKLCIETTIKIAVKLSRGKKNSVLNDSILVDDIEKNYLSFHEAKYNDFNPLKNVLLEDNEKIILNKARNVLSNFEFQVYELKISGFENNEIANLLDRDYKAVDNALQRVKLKIKELKN